MSSKTGSTTQLPEIKRVAVITHGRAETSGEALEQLRALAEDRIELLLPDEEAAKHGDGGGADVATADLAVVLGGDGTMLRALQALPGHRGARARRQPRARRLPHVDRGRLARGGHTPRVRRGARARRAARAGGVGRRRTVAGGQRHGRRELDDRPDDRARLGDRRGGSGLAAVRRPDLLDAVGVDGLQPLERRSRARLGARRDGDHLRRAALAARAAAGGAARPGADRGEPHARM